MRSAFSILDVVEQSRRRMDVVTGRSSVVRLMQDQHRMMALLTQHDLATQVLGDRRRALDLIAGPNSTFRALEQSRHTLDRFSGQNSVFRMVRENRLLLDAIAQSPRFAAMYGTDTTVAAIAARPTFTTMVGTVVMPRSAWIDSIRSLRDGLGASLYAAAVAEFDHAAGLAEVDDRNLWWIERLPVSAQLGLLLVVLEVIQKLSEFGQDVSGVHLPPAYTTGVQLLFALATGIIAVIDARAKALSDGLDPE